MPKSQKKEILDLLDNIRNDIELRSKFIELLIDIFDGFESSQLYDIIGDRFAQRIHLYSRRG